MYTYAGHLFLLPKRKISDPKTGIHTIISNSNILSRLLTG
jgi:hypothetical protein